jgi:hypothetical protein
VLEIHNRTPFAARLVPWLDGAGSTHAIVVVKATFALGRHGLEPAREQIPVRLADEHTGEPGRSSVIYEADTAPQKSGTDVVFVASAHAPRAAPYVDVQLVAGPLQRVVRVFGDRTWQRSLGGVRPSAPRPFLVMPLVWERAFGGASEPQNPVGVGAEAEQQLPNLEDPHQPIAAPKDRPAPAGVGFVARSWPARTKLAGTLDDAYRRERAPLLPLDFDARYFDAAPPGWTSKRPFVGGERIWGSALLPGGRAFDTVLPRLDLVADVVVRGARHEKALTLDTVIVEPEPADGPWGRIELTARARFAVPKSILAVDAVRVRQVPA